MKRLRVGLIGAGVMGRRHLDVLSHCPSAEVVGVADHHVAAKVPEALLVRDLDDLLALRPEAVIVATPAASHRRVVELCLASAIHVLVEKPFAASAADAQALLDAARRSRCLLAVSHVERFSRAATAIRGALEAGPIRTIATTRLGPKPERIGDVGVLLDLAVHDIDLVRWVTGRDYVDVKTHTIDVSDDGHETAAMLAAVLDDGTVVTHQVSWLAQQPVRHWTLADEHGRADVFDLLPTGNSALAAQDEAFIAACLGDAGSSRLATAADGAAAVRIALPGSREVTLGRAQDDLRQRADPQPSLQRDPVVGA